MQVRKGVAFFVFAAACAMTQAQVTSNNGTANAVPKYSDANTITPSAINEVNGNVGIGTASPAWALDVRGNTTDAMRSNVQNSNAQGQALQQSTNDLGHITLFGIFGSQEGSYAGINADEGFIYGGGSQAVDIVSDGGFIKLITGPIRGQANEKMRVMANGNVGIGTTTPGSTLEVNGNVTLTAGSGAFVTFPDATVQSTAWNGTTVGGDYAESVDVGNDRSSYEPGDLIVIDAANPGRFLKSSAPYSRLVAGVFSTKPGLTGRRTTAPRPYRAAEVPMAMLGIAPTKVCTENGPVEPGDLLVSSSTPGYAMKGTDENRLRGAVIGKALAPLHQGSGMIEALIALQ